MKFNVLAGVVALAAIADAAPLRVLMISSGPLSPPPMIDRARFGHGVPLPPDVAHMAEGHHPHDMHPYGSPRMGRPCAGRMGAMKAKALEFSNAFRHALGLPPIEPVNYQKLHDIHHAKIIPTVGTPTFIDYKMVNGQMQGKTKGGDNLQILPVGNLPHPHYHSQSRPVMTEYDHFPSFLERLQASLVNLGVWESAAVSFVFGCGIGVLLRMMYVLTVIALRSIKGRNSEEVQYTRVAVIQDYEDVEQRITSPPPTYAYPVDEKHAEEVNTKTASAPN